MKLPGNILLLEPYYTGSHKSWAEGYAEHSRHNVQILSLPGNFWKWRMHGGAVTLARQFLESDLHPDVILATDMLDLSTFLSLTRTRTARTPTAIYFHENQLTYPWSPKDRDILKKRDQHYGFINFVSALSADAVFFNSRYHLDSFITELPRFLKHFPDYNEFNAVEQIRAKSEVLALGLDLGRFDEFRAKNRGAANGPARPLILWNHRWEFDKNPDEFFRTLFCLHEKGLDFEVAILGECFSQKPEIFTSAKERLGDRIVQFGFVESFAEYAFWLWRADILPVTSNQDFFGASVVEAIYCACFPLLPDRLAYPELIPEELHVHHFYKNFDDLVAKLEHAIKAVGDRPGAALGQIVKKFDWDQVVREYDRRVEKLAQNHRVMGF